ncbi:hypothetical protein FB451DRAFT_269461 [Mycena latifolia]|nr:hypothetical protein FB451DRAFT_269461 [Mycena latifolia]
MEQEEDRPEWHNGSDPRISAQSPSSMLQDATGFRIVGSQFTNVQGNMHIHHAPSPAQPQHNPLPSSTNGISTESGSYCYQLLRRGRGFPLYIPEPRTNLPMEYQRTGVTIGDVGRVTPEGAFDFFFNIYCPSDHPVNADVPEGFVPLSLYDAIDVFHLDIEPGSYVSSPSVHRIPANLGIPE